MQVLFLINRLLFLSIFRKHITFELTSKEGHTWQAWRMLDYQDRIVTSRRGSPSFPYVFHHLTWTCEPAEENGVTGTLMTWADDFEMDAKSPIKNEVAHAPMLEHMTEAQENFKRVIENYLAAGV